MVVDNALVSLRQKYIQKVFYNPLEVKATLSRITAVLLLKFELLLYSAQVPPLDVRFPGSD